MFFSKQFIGASALASVLMTTTAMADVSARDVWESWRGYLGGFGYDINASESTSGDTLSVSDLTLSMPIPDEEGDITLTLGDLQFVGQGDGTVAVVLPSPMPMRFLVNADGENVDGELTLGHTGMTTIVSGTPDEMTYTYSADQMTADLTRLLVNGQAMPDIVFNMAMDGMQGTSKLVIGDVIETVQEASFEGITYAFSGADPDGGDKANMRGSMAGLKVEAEGVIPVGDYADDPAALFRDGFAIKGSYSLESSDIALAFEEDGQPGTIKAVSGAGTMNIVMNDKVMAYGGNVRDVTFNMMAPDVPLPIDVSMGEMGYGFDIPLKASPEPQDFALNLILGDLAVSEMIWGMIDPGQTLPHDPATLVVDMTGKTTIFQDLMTLDENASAAPGELNALTLADLRLTIAGAELTGQGDFTFDNSDMQSFDGMPRPEGALDLKLVGANALMDKLVAMGLLPEDQAMGARMMLSMFAVPGEGEDELNSTIEVNEQGHVLANGQRLK